MSKGCFNCVPVKTGLVSIDVQTKHALPFVTWISSIYCTFHRHKLVQKRCDFLKFLLGKAYRASARSHGNLTRIRQEKLRFKAKEITASGISKLASISKLLVEAATSLT